MHCEFLFQSKMGTSQLDYFHFMTFPVLPFIERRLIQVRWRSILLMHSLLPIILIKGMGIHFYVSVMGHGIYTYFIVFLVM